MSNNFEWQTDDDESLWEETDQSQLVPRGRRRLWPYMIAGLLALSLVGLVVIRQVNQRVEETESQIKEDVLAANKLVQRAAAESDSDLLISMLSGRDARWTNSQQDLSSAQLLFGKAAAPFGLYPVGIDPVSESVDLSRNLREAFVAVERTYELDVGNGITDTVALEQTVVYRRGGSRWLLSPPQDEFWGGWATTSGHLAAVAYPARDESFVVRFAIDVEAKLTELCNLHECPEALRVSIRFDPDPEALLALVDPETRLEPGTSLNLPTPSLVGMPVDEDGYSALSRAYSALVVAAVLGELLDWECCDRIAFYEAAVNQTLVNLALIPDPLQSADYLDLANYPIASGIRPASVWEARSLASLSAADRNYAQAVVEYLLAEGADLAEIQEQLLAAGNRRRSGGLTQWMERLSVSFFDMESWDRFVLERVAEHQSSQQPPLPIPDQDLLLACKDEATETAGLFRYDVGTEVFGQEMPVPSGLFFGVALPDDSGYIMVTGEPSDSLTETHLVRDGKEPIQISWDAPEDVLVYFGEPADPLGEYVVVWIIEADAGPKYGLLAYSACQDAAGCRPVELPGSPAWSPDGQKLIVATNDGYMLLGDRDLEGWTSLGPGFSPFWIDNDRYGYTRDGNSGIFMAQVGAGEPELLLTAGELTPFLPQRGPRFRPTFQRVFTHPALPNSLLIVTTNGLSDNALLFRVNLPEELLQPGSQSQAAPVDIALLVDGLLLSLPEPMQLISPNGRWLAAISSPRGFLFYDLEAGETLLESGMGESFSFGLHDWSMDSLWMAYVGARYVELLAPLPDGGLFRRILFHDDYLCSSAIWVNKAP